jgi:DNA-binding response OmpR family regulator
VEDYASFREGLAYLLSDRFEVVGVGTGEQAVELAGEIRPDVVVLDLKLPGISGEEVLRQLRARRIGIPVLILSAIHDPSTAARLVLLGARDYLTKPVGVGALVAKIDELFSDPGELAPCAN